MARVVAQEFKDSYDNLLRNITNQLSSIDKRNEVQARGINAIRQAMLTNPTKETGRIIDGKKERVARFEDGASVTVDADGLVKGNDKFDSAIALQINKEQKKYRDDNLQVEKKGHETEQAQVLSAMENDMMYQRKAYDPVSQAANKNAENQMTVLEGDSSGVPANKTLNNKEAADATTKRIEKDVQKDNATATNTDSKTDEKQTKQTTQAPGRSVEKLLTNMQVSAGEGYGLTAKSSEDRASFKASDTQLLHGQKGYEIDPGERASSDELMFQGLLYNAYNASDPNAVLANPYFKAAEKQKEFEDKLAMIGANPELNVAALTPGKVEVDGAKYTNDASVKRDSKQQVTNTFSQSNQTSILPNKNENPKKSSGSYKLAGKIYPQLELSFTNDDKTLPLASDQPAQWYALFSSIASAGDQGAKYLADQIQNHPEDTKYIADQFKAKFGGSSHTFTGNGYNITMDVTNTDGLALQGGGTFTLNYGYFGSDKKQTDASIINSQ